MSDTLKRAVQGRSVEDTGTIENVQYNSMSGGQKNLGVGPALKFVGILTAAVAVPKGVQLFIYNTTAADLFVKMGTSAVGIPGIVPAADTFPCAPGLTPYSAADYSHVIGTAPLYLYILRDETVVRNNP